MPNIKFTIELELVEKDARHWGVIVAGKRFTISHVIYSDREVFQVFVHSGYSIPLGECKTFDEAFELLKKAIPAGDRFTSGVE